MEQKKPKRRNDLDWLRVLLILSVFLYHSGRAFNRYQGSLEAGKIDQRQTGAVQDGDPT